MNDLFLQPTLASLAHWIQLQYPPNYEKCIFIMKRKKALKKIRRILEISAGFRNLFLDE